MGYVGQTSLIHGSYTSQFTGLIGYAANVKVLETTGHASTGQSFFDGTVGAYMTLAYVVVLKF